MVTERTPPSALVSQQMRRMPTRGTKPELALRSALHAKGLRFRVTATTLPGRPDIVFTRARIAVFVDGCFWHSCPQHSTRPRNNAEWWQDKLAATVERDRRKDAELEAQGWVPIHVWEHEEPSLAAARIKNLWIDRLASRHPRSGAIPSGMTLPSDPEILPHL